MVKKQKLKRDLNTERRSKYEQSDNDSYANMNEGVKTFKKLYFLIETETQIEKRDTETQTLRDRRTERYKIKKNTKIERHRNKKIEKYKQDKKTEI